jgi:hypothetical protein
MMTEKTGQYKFLPDKQYLLELLRPWKLATFGLGMSWLFYGALFYGISDWDIGVSLIMGGLTYLCAPWSVHVIFNAARYRPRGWPLHIVAAFLPALFAVDWAYWLYHTAMGNAMLRWDNFKASSALYFICGSVWYYRGSLRDIIVDIKKAGRSEG